MKQLVTTVIILASLPVAGSVLYFLVVAVASFFYRPRPVESRPGHRLVILVPAHNEAALIRRCVSSLLSQSYPRPRYRVVVVADNCTDETAAIARSAGAEVLVRDEPGKRGKGQALRWAMDRVLAAPSPPDAVVVIDADSVVDQHFLRGLATELAAGHEVVQAEDLVLADRGSPRAELEAAALLLQHRVRFCGRAVLGMPAFLCGNGMLLSRRVLEQHPWSAFTSVEDAEYSMTLRMAGLKTAYACGAYVYAEPTPGERAAFLQSLRWDGGRFFMMRRWLGRLLWQMVRYGRWDLVDTALELATPPLGLMLMAALVGTFGSALAVALWGVASWALLPWALSLVAIPAYVLIGLRAARAPASVYRAVLVRSPRFVARKVLVYARLLLGADLTRWVRTERRITG